MGSSGTQGARHGQGVDIGWIARAPNRANGRQARCRPHHESYAIMFRGVFPRGHFRQRSRSGRPVISAQLLRAILREGLGTRRTARVSDAPKGRLSWAPQSALLRRISIGRPLGRLSIVWSQVPVHPKRVASKTE